MLLVWNVENDVTRCKNADGSTLRFLVYKQTKGFFIPSDLMTFLKLEP